MPVNDIQYKKIYSSRRTLAISILRDGSVVVRAPWGTPDTTVEKLIRNKASWIIKHSADIRSRRNPARQFIDGEKHLYKGRELALRIVSSSKPYCRFLDQEIEIGVNGKSNNVRSSLYRGYTEEAERLFPYLLNNLLKKFENQGFRVSRLVIRTLKSRWGSCSSSGKITLNTELVRLPEKLTEYVIIHELCHLKHHNHGTGFYVLLEELCPEWKTFRKELKKNIL
jgi:predicted metal-dependent hydrolase